MQATAEPEELPSLEHVPLAASASAPVVTIHAPAGQEDVASDAAEALEGLATWLRQVESFTTAEEETLCASLVGLCLKHCPRAFGRTEAAAMARVAELEERLEELEVEVALSSVLCDAPQEVASTQVQEEGQAQRARRRPAALGALPAPVAVQRGRRGAGTHAYVRKRSVSNGAVPMADYDAIVRKATVAGRCASSEASSEALESRKNTIVGAVPRLGDLSQLRSFTEEEEEERPRSRRPLSVTEFHALEQAPKEAKASAAKQRSAKLAAKLGHGRSSRSPMQRRRAEEAALPRRRSSSAGRAWPEEDLHDKPLAELHKKLSGGVAKVERPQPEECDLLPATLTAARPLVAAPGAGPGGLRLSGVLYKSSAASRLAMHWQRRWCSLDDTALSFYRAAAGDEGGRRGSSKSTVLLGDVQRIEMCASGSGLRKHAFRLVLASRTMYLSCGSAAEREEWLRALSELTGKELAEAEDEGGKGAGAMLKRLLGRTEATSEFVIRRGDEHDGGFGAGATASDAPTASTAAGGAEESGGGGQRRPAPVRKRKKSVQRRYQLGTKRSEHFASEAASVELCQRAARVWLARREAEKRRAAEGAMREQRRRIEREVIETEREYAKCLSLVVRFYLEPLRKHTGEGGLFTAQDEKWIFSNISIIASTAGMLLEQLSAAESPRKAKEDGDSGSGEAPPCMGEVFITMAPFFSHYTEYVNNYQHSVTSLARADGRQATRAFLKKCRESCREHLEKEHAQAEAFKLNIEDMLIMPVQRVPRYVLLLEQLLKASKKTDAHYAKTQEAYELFRDIAAGINRAKRQLDDMVKVLEVQALFDYSSVGVQLVEPHRMWLKDALVQVWPEMEKSHESHCFLFNDVLLFGHRKKSTFRAEQYELEDALHLATAFVVNDEENDKALRIMYPSSTEGLQMCFSSGAEKDEWKQLLSEQIHKLVDGGAFVESSWIDDAFKTAVKKGFLFHLKGHDRKRRQFVKLKGSTLFCYGEGDPVARRAWNLTDYFLRGVSKEKLHMRFSSHVGDKELVFEAESLPEFDDWVSLIQNRYELVGSKNL